jgi:hypothetical protein
MAYTEFGEFFRILRIKNHEVLADAKVFLGVSTAFISSVECGKKRVPSDWFNKITDHYNLSQEEQAELRHAIDNSKKIVKFDLSAASSLQKSVVLQFQRSFDEADEETMKEIQKVLERRFKK